MHDRIVGLYEENAAAWSEARGRTLHPGERGPFAHFLRALRPGAAVLDLGCGTGEPIGRLLLERGCRLTGLDSSPSLVALARERLPEGEWLVGDMRALDLGRQFDAVLAWHSFFHLSIADQRAVIPRFAAHAGPGAALCFTSGPRHGEAIGEWQGEPLFHASLAPAEYARLLDENGFDVLRFTAGEPVAAEPSVWLARRRATTCEGGR
jgi:SAM-dependent methyltransferase